jgi:hypothetical protein
LRIEVGQIKADAAAKGALQNSRIIVVAITAADEAHKAAMSDATPIMLDFIERTQLAPAEIVGWARPHLENLGNSLLAIVPPSNFSQDYQRLTNQYRAVFQQATISASRQQRT